MTAGESDVTQSRAKTRQDRGNPGTPEVGRPRRGVYPRCGIGPEPIRVMRPPEDQG